MRHKRLFKGLLSSAMPFVVWGTVTAATDMRLRVTDGTVHAVLETNGVIYLAGEFKSVGVPGGGLVALDARTAAVDERFPKVKGGVTSVISDGAGGWFVGGQFGQVWAVVCSNLVHIRSDLTVDKNWKPLIDGSIHAQALKDGRLYVGGMFTSVNKQPRLSLAALDVQTGALLDWDPAPKQLEQSVPSGSRNSAFSSPIRIRGLAAWKDRIYVMGDFPALGGKIERDDNGRVKFGGTQRNGLAAVHADTGEILNWPSEVTTSLGRATYESLVVTEDAVVLAGDGLSFGKMAPRSPPQMGGPRLAILNHGDGAPVDWFPHRLQSGLIADVAVFGRKIILAGDIEPTFFGLDVRLGGPSEQLAMLDLESATTTRDFPPFQKPRPRSFLRQRLVTLRETLYVAGRFTECADQPRPGLAAVDLKTRKLLAWNPNVFGQALALHASGNRVIAGGVFQAVDLQPRQGVAAIDAQTGRLLDWAPQLDGPAKSLAWVNQRLIVSGDFTRVGNIAASGIAVLDPVTGRLVPTKSAELSARPPQPPVISISLASELRFMQINVNFPTVNSANTLGSPSVILEATTNLVDWVPVATNQVPFGFEDVEAFSSKYRFYRVRERTPVQPGSQPPPQ